MEISQFYDVNKRTQTEQVLKNQEDIKDLQNADGTLQENIDKEVQDRTDADASLAYDIGELQSQIDGLGNVFTLKGSVATYGDLPATDNHIGDVWYVEADAVGYVWIDDNGTERWEQLGLPIDLSDYVTTSDLALALEEYQEKLIAGTNISIIDNVISATGGSNNAVLLDNSTQEFNSSKNLELKANESIKIVAKSDNTNYFQIRCTNDNHIQYVLHYGNFEYNFKDSGGQGGGTYNIVMPSQSGKLALVERLKNYFFKINLSKADTLNVYFNIGASSYSIDNNKWQLMFSTDAGAVNGCVKISGVWYNVFAMLYDSVNSQYTFYYTDATNGTSFVSIATNDITITQKYKAYNT